MVNTGNILIFLLTVRQFLLVHPPILNVAQCKAGFVQLQLNCECHKAKNSASSKPYRSVQYIHHAHSTLHRVKYLSERFRETVFRQWKILMSKSLKLF